MGRIWEVILGGLVGGGVVSGVLGYMTANRSMDIKMVEIAVGVLSQEPTERTAAARTWAVDVINSHSDVKMPPEARASFMSNPFFVKEFERALKEKTDRFDETKPSPAP